MIQKILEKKKAIALRKKGKTYSEILSAIPVAKSTLALWLAEIGLSKKQIHRISEIKRAASIRGGQIKKNQRNNRLNQIVTAAKKEIGSMSFKNLFLIGIALYWAEGAKEKPDRPGSGFQFGNMDPQMILLMLTWLQKVCKIEKSMIVFELYLHKSHEYRLGPVKEYWSEILNIPKETFFRVYFKSNKIKETNRKNTDEKYYGLIRLKVPQSSVLVRKIAGWTQGIIQSV